MTDQVGQTPSHAPPPLVPLPEPKVPTTPPWAMIVVLSALVAVSVGAVWVLVSYRGLFQAPTDVTLALSSWFTVVGTIVGAYFGIQGSTAANVQPLTVSATLSTHMCRRLYGEV